MTQYKKHPPQFIRSIHIPAPRRQVWEILADAGELPSWAPAVVRVVSHDPEEVVGARRVCAVELNGRAGRMVERVVEREELRMLGYQVEDESFGMARLFDDYGFRILLDDEDEGTRVIIETQYAPRHLGARVLNATMMRRKMAGVVDTLLEGLRGRVAA